MFGVREKKARTSKKSQGKSGERENEQKLCHDYILDVHRDRRNQFCNERGAFGLH